MFFDSLTGLLRVATCGVLSYLALVIMLRASGKRTLSKLNAFDLIVTIALGSTLATILLTKTVALLEGLLAFAVLIGMQYIVAWVSARSVRARKLVKSEPRLLLLRGRMLPESLAEERLTEEEVFAAIRGQGIASAEKVEAVVLETDGSISVIKRREGETSMALDQVHGFHPRN